MKRNGFNFAETMVSLSLISFLILFSLPSLKSIISKLNFKSAQSQVINSLYLARYKSAFTGVSYRWKALGDAIAIERKSEGKWILEIKIKLSYGTVSSNNIPIFHPEGLVTNMATIYLKSKKVSSKITVAITGRIKVDEGN